MYCVSTIWSNCIRESWICDGASDCDNGEDEKHCGGVIETTSNKRGNEGTLQDEVTSLEDIMGKFWTIFFVGVILSVVCLTGKKGVSEETSEDIEQTRDHATSSASRHLPAYYLHTLHRPQFSTPTTVILSGESGTCSSCSSSNQGWNDVSREIFWQL